MNQEAIVSFLDLLDLDEEVIDTRLKALMSKSNLTNTHLSSVIHLLQYKTLINTQENTECDNNSEFDFIVNLLKDLNDDNVDNVCKIVYIVLSLNPISLESKGEHLLQQILANIELQIETTNKTEKSTDILRNLKICGSILDAVIKYNKKLSLYFTKTPLEDILEYPDETLKKYFLNSTVPKLFNGIIGYNILDRVWDYVKKLKRDKKSDALKILSCLADFYVPSQERENAEIISDIISEYDFWSLVLYGMSSEDTQVRKISVYLAKRAIDCAMVIKRDIDVEYENVVIFLWSNNKSKAFKSMWDNFFILIESLEEKQSNIVLPSLKLFETIDIGEVWMYCAFKLGLKHDNFQVRLKCIEYRLNYKINNQSEAGMILEALNDINIYDNNTHYDVIKIKLSKLVNDDKSLMEFLKTIPLIQWSPIPLHHVIAILSKCNIEVQTGFIEAAIDILNTPCNNILLRKQIHNNFGIILRKCTKLIKWQDMVRIYSTIGFENPSQLEPNHPLVLLIQEIKLQSEEKNIFVEEIFKSSKNVDILVLYHSYHKEDENILIDLINKKFDSLDQLEETQNSNLKEDLHFVISMMLLYNETKLSRNLEDIRTLIAKRNSTLLGYIYKLFKEGACIHIEDIIALLKVRNTDFEDGEIVLRMALYRQCLIAHFPDADVMHTHDPNSFCLVHPESNAEFTLTRKILYMFLLRIILNNPQNPLTEQSGAFKLLHDTLKLFYDYKSHEKSFECVGRVKNVDQEIFCEVIYLLTNKVNDEELQNCLVMLIDYTENALECGGYSCLEWVLKISNIIMKYLVNINEDFNLPQFINKLWREIEELKANNQYNICIKLFIEVLTNDALLENEKYNNIVTLFISKIVEISSVKINPLYYLLKQLESKNINKYGHLVYGFCDMLLFNPVKRKDERITDNLIIELLQDQNASIDNDRCDIPFTFKLQYLSLSILCNIKDVQTIKLIRKLIRSKIDDLFKNKQRYHGNSQLHKTLQIALQHLIILVLKDKSDLEDCFNWSLDMFVKLPHQSSVRICFEWLITLYFYINKTTIDERMLQALKVKNVPLTSQLFVVYWLLKHKIKTNCFMKTEFDFAMDFLLSHTMGQLFNVRLNAQYLSTIIYKLTEKSTKFEYTISMIEKTFAESNTDKTYVKLQSDYFVHDFDIVANLTPYFLYHILPKYCGVTSNENVMVDYVKNLTDAIAKNLGDVNGDEFISEWMICRQSNDDFVDLEENKTVDNGIDEDVNLSGIIQKKYIPWRNMSDVNVYDVLKKQQSSSELIVVASLIDKLPNLGGMARTSEVFGVKTYVVDSLRHLQDKQFQNLSVSAERWIDVEEVRPGKPLRDYLMKMKSEGYSIVAAEQTSSSHQLQSFEFPKKTLLLLGHEKEGVPCDLLPIMDYCVEIPQQGYVRSLNVHVTAAIFVWEYARQHVL